MSNRFIPCIRLNKFISNAGVCARREADRFIASGAITVDGKVVRAVGTKIALHAEVAYKGTVLHAEKPVYILLNKPMGYVTTLQDPEGRKTVVDLISKRYCPERIYPIGRLDYNTMGLLVLTNDGALAQQLAHPSSQVQKCYHVVLHKAIQTDHCSSIEQGIVLEDGFVKVDKLVVTAYDARQLKVVLHIGKNRIVRRIFEHFGYSIQKLDRIGYAHLTKKNLSCGQWIFLDAQEVAKLKK